MPPAIDPHHRESRFLLRLLGPAAIVVGGVFTAIGSSAFFSASTPGTEPSRFWLAFLGVPLLGAGLTMTKWAYLGAISRYAAAEVAPVAASTLDYLGHRTTTVCTVCGTPNERGSRFCERCGSELAAVCPSCGAENDAHANFCHGCGTAL